MRHWFLPRDPDLLGLLREQGDTTLRGMTAFVAWSRGDVGEAQSVRDAHGQATEQRRHLNAELRAAFSTPLDAEDIYELSERLDDVLTAAKNAVRESEVMSMPPDEALAEMAGHLLVGVEHLVTAFTHLGRDHDAAVTEADAAIAAEIEVERGYRRAMSALLQTGEVRELLGRRELYRRYSRLADAVVRVGERVWYAVVKQA